MNAKPILFSNEMVRALLEGRKTQTRRVVNNPEYFGCLTGDCPHDLSDECANAMRAECPYGKPGDLLWVRETWADLIAVSPATDKPMDIGPGERLIQEPTFWTDEKGRQRWNYDGQVIAYRANSDVEFCDGDGFMGDMADRSDMPRWRSPIHMPRWASRLTLRITDVRVQRLQDISEADAKAEGVQMEDERYWVDYSMPGTQITLSAKKSFNTLWESINGPGSWEANPWVWALTFEVIKANVDAVIKENT